MSRAFTREEDGDPDRLPDKPSSSLPNYITPAGLSALRGRAKDLAERAAAAAPEDPERPVLERDLRHLRERLARAIEVDPREQPRGEARFGASVAFEEKGRTREVRLVGEDEVDEARGLVAWSSALGMALIGLKPGEEAPFGDGVLRVRSVRYQKD